MAGDNKMARDLLHLLSPYSYTNSIGTLTGREIVKQSNFSKTALGARFWLDTRRCYRLGRKNPDQLFEIFAAFNGEDPDDVRSDMWARIKMEKPLYSKVGHIILSLQHISMDTWITNMQKKETFGDELMLYALARTFQRHIVVYTEYRCWSTVGTDVPINGDRLLDICHVQLVHVGKDMYAELRPKPFNCCPGKFNTAATTPHY